MTPEPPLDTPSATADFIASHRLPAAFESTITAFYAPLAEKLPQLRPASTPLILGVCGAQGTGKSTLADYLAMHSAKQRSWNCAVLSLDDFYLTHAERKVLARSVHPLLATRGVPGTHDTAMLSACMDRLLKLGAGEECRLPRFNKATDDQFPEEDWPIVAGPLDLVILEGWCVGATPATSETLTPAINELEKNEDANASWRTFVNDQLAGVYQDIFARLHTLIFLAAPSIEAIFRWRLEQEQKLARRADPDSTAIMAADQISRFILYFERITRNMLEVMPQQADVLLQLNEDHRVVSSNNRL